ncbi:SRPBCC family protein [Actinokineospora guangxiensis]|uniref:SRPBCC family protein n=1 Tax=Actinokineospora guangxiensis TaxID=1490288 RepID=A0ABW0EHA1_9PSEU
MSTPDAQGQIAVSASAARVYELVSDLPAMARMAEEFAGGRWLGRDTIARVGARFRGSNRRGVRFWTTVATVTAAAPDKFAFRVSSMGLPVSEWAYEITPTESGCRVVESAWDLRPGWFRPLTVLATGVTDRKARNQANIATTLARLKAAAEG